MKSRKEHNKQIYELFTREMLIWFMHVNVLKNEGDSFLVS